MYDIAFLARSKVKIKILELLNKPKTATRLAKELNVHRSSVSRILLILEEKGFVKCANPKDAMNRYYIITDKAKRILKKLTEIES